MALLPNQNRSFYLMLLFLYSCVELGASVPSAIAHNVEVAGDVAATMHLEPNHNPKAGEPALVWFALTRQGGELIPLKQCNCRLAIYPEPRSPGSLPVLQPALKSIDAERYQGIPGAEVTFPQSGLYLMALSGTPKAGANFQAFELTYPITVTAGPPRPVAQKSTEQPTSVVARDALGQATDASPLVWQIGAVAGALAIGLGAIALKRQQRK
ncbi:hypothetical protein [Pantanalinema sp. GBBB05]|uniref:hypothetical protein n=1 Tax=Pantanalinema sp. GBBB05 TaxID=2604139 RepID=UPI003D81BF02